MTYRLPPPAVYPRHHRRHNHGFTLAELLLAITLGSLVITGALRVLVSDTRSGITFAASQGLRNDFARITGFLETEIGEGETISYGQALTGCTSATGGAPTGSSLFTINVPFLNGNTRTFTTVHFYADGTNLMRCGPPICTGTATGSCTATNAGALNVTGTRLSSIVHRNATLTLVNATDPEAVTYNLALTQPAGTISQTRTNIQSSTKVSFIPTS